MAVLVGTFHWFRFRFVSHVLPPVSFRVGYIPSFCYVQMTALLTIHFGAKGKI